MTAYSSALALVRLGAVDGMVAGSGCPTANVLRAALQVVGTKLGLKTVSSSIDSMFTSKKEYGDDGMPMVLLLRRYCPNPLQANQSLISQNPLVEKARIKVVEATG